MIYFFKSEIVPHDKDEILCLILDVEQYPNFVPFCKSTKIINRDINKNMIVIDTTMSFSHITTTYRSIVTYVTDSTNSRITEINIKAGKHHIIKHLLSQWRVTEMPSILNNDSLVEQKTGNDIMQEATKCKVDFYINLSLQSKIYEKLVNLNFNDLSEKTFKAFINKLTQ